MSLEEYPTISEKEWGCAYMHAGNASRGNQLSLSILRVLIKQLEKRGIDPDSSDAAHMEYIKSVYEDCLSEHSKITENE